ncbi:MFS transporter [Nocardia sp. CA2R105]|uniref:MFS transporter n=1 Tax=Nocardia coffeae TaxID=2873381 RepID=UPI001CA65BE3|nr:MFS transporter [Nocardia coffeae]MBY8856667.1 MFS transporter [Nocardia coffeae]
MASSPPRRRSILAGLRPPGGRNFLLLLAATLGTFANYAPMLSVVPLWCAEGGAAYGGVGATTGVTMAATVAIQLCMKWLLRRFTLRSILITGALVLGAPTFGYLLSSGLAWVLTVSALRGVGFGMVAVAGSALVAELVPAQQRGRAVGWYGIAVGLPQMVFLPLGVWGAQRLGFVAVFVVAGVLSLAAVPLTAAISGHQGEPAQRGRPGAPTGTAADGPDLSSTSPTGGYRPLAAPWLLLITTAGALGGVTSFLPLALRSPTGASTALFTLTATVIVGRWLAGVRSDRKGAGGLLMPGVTSCAAGMATMAWAAGTNSGTTALAAAAAAVYGLGFGAVQNDTLVLMFHRAGPTGHGVASTVWNMAYDGGTGIGSLAVGLLSQATALSTALLATALPILAALPWAWLTSYPRKAARTERKRNKSDPTERQQLQQKL